MFSRQLRFLSFVLFSGLHARPLHWASSSQWCLILVLFNCNWPSPLAVMTQTGSWLEGETQLNLKHYQSGKSASAACNYALCICRATYVSDASPSAIQKPSKLSTRTTFANISTSSHATCHSKELILLLLVLDVSLSASTPNHKQDNQTTQVHYPQPDAYVNSKFRKREDSSRSYLSKLIIFSMYRGAMTQVWKISQIQKIPVTLTLNISRTRVKITNLWNLWRPLRAMTADGYYLDSHRRPRLG